jgi:hypothetical protein
MYVSTEQIFHATIKLNVFSLNNCNTETRDISTLNTNQLCFFFILKMLIIYFIYSGSSRTDNSGILLEDVRFEFRIKNYKSNYRLSEKVRNSLYFF